MLEGWKVGSFIETLEGLLKGWKVQRLASPKRPAPLAPAPPRNNRTKQTQTNKQQTNKQTNKHKKW